MVFSAAGTRDWKKAVLAKNRCTEAWEAEMPRNQLEEGDQGGKPGVS